MLEVLLVVLDEKLFEQTDSYFWHYLLAMPCQYFDKETSLKYNNQIEN